MRAVSTLAVLALGCSGPTAGSADAGEPDAGALDAGTLDGGAASRRDGLVQVAMRDGVRLKTWVYVPRGAGPFPFFMVRNPYAQFNVEAELQPYARFFTDRGIGLLWQATRGTGGSEGRFVPHLSEMNDGRDTTQWLAAQPYSNGRVAVGGGSYLGYTAFAAAANNPHVVAILSDDTAADEEMTRHRGVVNGYVLSWWSLVERGRLATEAEQRLLTNGLDALAADHGVLGRDEPYWDAVLSAGPTVFPPDVSLRRLARDICAPALHILEGESEWDDPRLTWEAIAAEGCPRERDHQWLIVAPESHAHHINAFGVSDTWLTGDMLAFLEAFLLQKSPAPTWPRVRYRVEPQEPTRTATAWPPPASRSTTLFLGAPGTTGEGTLRPAAPSAGAWTMVSDPAGTDPCALPTSTWFTSAPLGQDLVLTGAAVLHLRATTTAADFDVHVQLYDYLAGPEEYRALGTGAVRARFHTGVDAPLPTSPFDLDIALTPMARRVPAGHQLTVALSPSRCEFVENPHSGEPAERQTRRLTARVSFTLGAQGARLVLPEVP